MKRAQRKANFKKLFQNTEQNSNDNKTIERRETRSSKPSNTVTAGLSKCVGKENNDACSEKETLKKITQVSPFSKRVNLTRFLFQDKKDIPPEVLKHDTSSDDFETPIKKIKSAPKLSQKAEVQENLTTKNTRKRKRSKQPTIKSALLRNEQMFSEIAAQHCIVENFSPEDVQMALVISRSEVETCHIEGAASVAIDKPTEKNTDAIGVDETTGEDIRSKLQKYGFRTAAKGDYANCFAAAFLVGQRRAKTKWANKFTALTLRNPEVQTKKLNKNIETMLAQYYPPTQAAPTSNKFDYVDYKVKSQFLNKHSVADPNDQFFRNIESLTLTDHFEKFFISELFPVTRLPVDHLLKDWTSIPGRDVSPQRRKRKELSLQEKKFENFYKELEHDFLKIKKIEEINENKIDVDTVAQLVNSLDQNEHNNFSVQPIEKKSKVDLDDLVNDVVQLDHSNKQNEHRNSFEINEPLENYQSETELDGLLKVIAQQTTNEVEKSSELNSQKVSKENSILNCSILAEQIKSSDDLKTCRKDDFLITNTQTRSVSPDLFAESDSDGGDLVEENNLNNITTIENYSSDEVKTCLDAGNNKQELLSMKVYDTVDLTQDEHVEKIQSPTLNLKRRENDTLQFHNYLENSFLEKQNIANKTVLNTQKENLIMKAIGLKGCDIVSEKCSQSSNTNDNVENLNQSTEIVAIDLTQSDHEISAAEDDDDCVVLSDDEINYSILKAKEIEEHKTNSCENIVNLSNASSDRNSNSSLNQCIVNPNNFSVLEFVEEQESFYLNKNDSNDDLAGMPEGKKSFNLNFSGDLEPIKSQYLTKTVEIDNFFSSEKRNKSFDFSINGNLTNQNYLSPSKLKMNATINEEWKTPLKNDVFSTPGHYKAKTPSKSIDVDDLLKSKRAEFGILESQSEPFSQTPPLYQQTPNKITTTPTIKCDSPLNISNNFGTLSRRTSNQNNKFTSFLYDTQKNSTYSNDLGIQPLVDEDDFDEFDRLVYGSPPQKKAEGVPTGFSQLLTGEISLNLSNGTSQKVEDFELKTTPEKREEIKINEHIYYVRKTRSPKPNFEQQTEAEILKQLYEIGVKPLKRQHAIKLLEYVYNETHPIIEMETSSNSLKPQSNNNELMATQSQARNSQCLVQDECHTKSKDSTSSKSATKTSKKFNFQDCYGNILLRFSHELSAELKNEEIYIFQTNVTKKTLQPLLPLHIAWFNLICSNVMLHESILMYEPIDLQEVYLFFKSIGYRYDPKDLKNFFDQRCIIFRYDLTPPEKQKNRHLKKTNIKKTNNKI